MNDHKSDDKLNFFFVNTFVFLFVLKNTTTLILLLQVIVHLEKETKKTWRVLFQIRPIPSTPTKLEWFDRMAD